jgi:hypothetical protein
MNYSFLTRHFQFFSFTESAIFESSFISGSIPSEIGYLSNLGEPCNFIPFYMSYINLYLTSIFLVEFDLDGCFSINGTIPSEIGMLEELSE